MTRCEHCGEEIHGPAGAAKGGGWYCHGCVDSGRAWFPVEVGPGQEGE